MSVAAEKIAKPEKVVFKHKKQMRWHMIAGLCLLNGWRTGAEIGVSTGRFSLFLCAAMHDMHMLAVDEWAEKPDNTGPGQQTYVGWNGEYWMKRLMEASEQYLQDRITVWRMDSVAASRIVADGSLDFVFIDAEHSYEACKRDIAAWAPKVRAGGMVSGHDYHKNWPGVIQAVDELGEKVVQLPDAVWFYRK